MKVLNWISNFSKRTMYHFSVVFIWQACAAGLSFLLYLYLGNFHGKEVLGEYSFYYSLGQLIILFSGLGITNYLSKELFINKNKVSGVFYKSVKLTVISSFVIFLLFVLFNELFNSLGLQLIDYLLFFIFCIATSVLITIGGIIRGLGDLVSTLKYSILGTIIIIISFYVISNGIDLRKILSVLAISSLVLVPFIYFHYKKYSKDVLEKLIDRKKSFKSISYPDLFWKSLPYLVATINFNIIYYLDKYLLGVLFSFSELGTYTAYSTVLNSARLLVGIVPLIILPLGTSKKYDFLRSSLYISLIFIPFSLLILAIAYFVVPIIYGVSYHLESINLLLWMTISNIVFFYFNFFLSIYLAEHKEAHLSNKSLLIRLSICMLLFILVFPLISIYFKGKGVVSIPMAQSFVLLVNLFVVVSLAVSQRKNLESIKFDSGLFEH